MLDADTLKKKKINFLLQKELRFEDKFHMRGTFRL